MSRFINPVIHLLLLAGIFIVPLLGLILAPELYKASGIINYLVANAVNFGIYLLVFYFAVPKLLSANRYAFFYLGLLILVAASTFLKLELLDLIRERYPGQLFAISPEGSYYGRLILTFIFSLIFAFLGAFLRFTVDWFKNRQQMLKMDDNTIRITGLVMMLFGVGMLYLVR